MGQRSQWTFMVLPGTWYRDLMPKATHLPSGRGITAEGPRMCTAQPAGAATSKTTYDEGYSTLFLRFMRIADYRLQEWLCLTGRSGILGREAPRVRPSILSSRLGKHLRRRLGVRSWWNQVSDCFHTLPIQVPEGDMILYCTILEYTTLSFL